MSLVATADLLPIVRVARVPAVVYRGAAQTLRIELQDAAGAGYDFTGLDEVRFTFRLDLDDDTPVLFTKTTADGLTADAAGICEVTLDTIDTSELSDELHVWDLWGESAGREFPLVPPQTIRVAPGARTPEGAPPAVMP